MGDVVDTGWGEGVLGVVVGRSVLDCFTNQLHSFSAGFDLRRPTPTVVLLDCVGLR